MLCGTRSFSDIDDRSGRASSPRPKLSKLKQSLSLDRGRKQSSNPYSNEGLDKFEKLIAELEAKKEEVLLKKKSSNQLQDHSSTIVRFKYNSDTGDWVPIIVRLQPEAKKEISGKEKLIPTEEKEVIEEVAGKKKVGKSSIYRWIIYVRQYFWATMIALVLLSCCCFILGRAFVVCSATVLWYMVPMMNSERSGSWDLKVYGKRLMISGDKWVGNGRKYLGVAAAASTSMNVKKVGSDRVLLVSNVPRRSTAK